MPTYEVGGWYTAKMEWIAFGIEAPNQREAARIAREHFGSLDVEDTQVLRASRPRVNYVKRTD